MEQKKQLTDEQKRNARRLHFFSIIPWVMCVAGAVYSYFLQKNSPVFPTETQTVEFVNHGFYFYTTPLQAWFFNILFYGGIIAYGVMMLWGFLKYGKPFFSRSRLRK